MILLLISRANKVNTGLAYAVTAVVITGLVFFFAQTTLSTALIYTSCGLFLEFLSWGVFIMGTKLGRKDAAKRHDRLNEETSSTQRVLGQTNDKELTNGLIAKKNTDAHQEKTSMELSDIPTTIYSELSSFFGGLFYSSPKTQKQNELNDLISRCKEETDIQNAEVRIITKALTEFNQEASFLSRQKIEGQFITENEDFQINTERTILSESRNHAGYAQHLLGVLSELMRSYPKSGYNENPCIATVELYIEARRLHHEDILSVALVLLPELHSSLNEFRATVNTGMNSSLR